jgi:hemoglobin/transferrin/lactoferrin receptor protein
MEGTYNYVNSTAFVEDIDDGSTGPLDTRYPDGGSSMSSAALYLTDTYEASSKVIFNGGIRGNYVGLHAEFVDTTFFPFPFHEVTQSSFAVNGSLGMIYMPGREWRFSLLGSTGFRAPNVDDLSKVFESVPGTVVVPNPELGPEKTLNAEIGIAKGFDERVRIEGVAYYTDYIDAITTQPSTFDGQDSIMYNGELSQVMTNVNASSAYIYGFSVNLEADVTDNFSLSSSLNYTYGRIRTDTTDYPLDHIPPIFGKTSLLLKVEKFRGEFYALYSGWKRVDDYNMYGEDNFAYATENGMPAWVTLNVRASYQFNKYIQLQLALENILDQNYRVFASNISAPGRNFVVTVRGSF